MEKVLNLIRAHVRRAEPRRAAAALFEIDWKDHIRTYIATSRVKSIHPGPRVCDINHSNKEEKTREIWVE
jgi:hypothetical protein